VSMIAPFPVAGVLGSSFGKLYGLPGKLPRGLDRAEEGGEWFGHDSCPRAALAVRGEVAGAMGELRGVRRWTEDATGKLAGHWGGLYSRGAGMVTGGRGRAGVHARACSERPPSVSPRRTRVCLLLPWFNGQLEHHSVKILENHCVWSLPCTISYLFYVSPKPRYGRGREI
jgi:hypothetical protein